MRTSAPAINRLRVERLGDLQRLTVAINGLGPTPSWHLASIAVTAEASGEAWHFPGAGCGAGSFE